MRDTHIPTCLIIVDAYVDNARSSALLICYLLFKIKTSDMAKKIIHAWYALDSDPSFKSTWHQLFVYHHSNRVLNFKILVFITVSISQKWSPRKGLFLKEFRKKLAKYAYKRGKVAHRPRSSALKHT